MSDAASARMPVGGGSRARRPRAQVPSRNSSTRSSAVYNDDYLQTQTYGYGYGSLGLRSTASRYSLNDQFAATRKEFDFGFDDGASAYERSTIASEAMGEHATGHDEDAGNFGPIVDYYDPSALQGRARLIDPFDLLVLPKNPSARDVRRAYFRLFTLLYPDAHPPKLRKAASVYFTLVQDAFEQFVASKRQPLEDLDGNSAVDLVLDEPGRYQIYQLWRIALSTVDSRHFGESSELRSSRDELSTSNSGVWALLRNHAKKIGLDVDQVRKWAQHGSAGLGLKLDAGSPHLFTSGLGGLSRFSVLNRHLLSLVPIRVAPRLELNCGFPGFWQRRHPQRPWTLSTAVEPHSLGASLKHHVDLDYPERRAGKSTLEGRVGQLIYKARRGLRLEAEISSGLLWSKFLALRCLKKTGRSSRLGFEVGFTSHQLHLSLYWSRLGQRIRLPFLVKYGCFISPRLLFWAAVLPFAGFAAWDIASYYRWLKTSHAQERKELVSQIQARRSEADDVTILLSANVENAQEVERVNRGLVILSAKYGVKKDESWGLEEVADVTTAVAALVDNSQVHIPSTVNKNNILGFWDPVPGTSKTLHVRYLYQGKESALEVGEQDELLLPPKK